MSRITANMAAYNICNESELTNILSNFNSEFIFTIVQDNIGQRFNNYTIGMVNIVSAYEQYFKQLIDTYPDNTQDIVEKRNQVYIDIINILCSDSAYGLQFNGTEDLYSAAFLLYGFLVSDFQNNIINFFTNYIIREKNTLYDMLNLNALKKNKDSSTIYTKKLFKNTKLAIIAANLEYVLNSITAFDIDFDTLLNNVYADRNIVKTIESIAAPRYDFYKYQFATILNTPLRTIIITEVRLKLQTLAMSDDVNIENIVNN